MDKERVIVNLTNLFLDFIDDDLYYDLKRGLLDKILEAVKPFIEEKPIVPQYVMDYYIQNKDNDFGSVIFWFDATELMDTNLGLKVHKWIYDTTSEEERERVYAFGTLIIKGIDAVEVEKEKKYVVKIPNKNSAAIITLKKDSEEGKLSIVPMYTGWGDTHIMDEYYHTEEEIKEDFEWAWDLGFAKEVEE